MSFLVPVSVFKCFLFSETFPPKYFFGEKSHCDYEITGRIISAISSYVFINNYTTPNALAIGRIWFSKIMVLENRLTKTPWEGVCANWCGNCTNVFLRLSTLPRIFSKYTPRTIFSWREASSSIGSLVTGGGGNTKFRTCTPKNEILEKYSGGKKSFFKFGKILSW